MSPEAAHAGGEADAQSATSRPARPRFVALVNARAGEVLQRGQSAFAEPLIAGLHQLGVDCDVRFADPGKLADEIKATLDRPPDALLVAGGDGTVNRLLPQLIAADVPVGLLPLGTLNLFARDVGLEGRLDAILPVLARRETRPFDLGEVNGCLFHSNAGLGFFARMAREREDARRMLPSSKSLGFMMAAMRSIWFHRPTTIEITLDGAVETHEADALLVTNNHFDGGEWRRDRLDAGLLEIHMLQAAGLVARVQAAAAVYRGTWRALPRLRSITARAVTVRRRGRSRSTIALDGEIYEVTNPIRFRSKPAAVTLIAGRPGPDRP